jgi:hypothetical protein
MTTPMRLLNMKSCTPGPSSGPQVLLTECSGRVTAHAVQPQPTLPSAFSIRVVADFFFLTGFSGLLKRVLPIIVLPGCNLAGAMIIANSLPFGSHSWYAASAALLGLFIGWLLLMRPEAFRKSIPSLLHLVHKIKGSEK